MEDENNEITVGQHPVGEAKPSRYGLLVDVPHLRLAVEKVAIKHNIKSLPTGSRCAVVIKGTLGTFDAAAIGEAMLQEMEAREKQ